MPKLKRDVVKYVRDKAKSKYEKATECRICGEAEQLDFHHFYSLTPLLNQWLTKNRHNPEYIMALRDDFIEEHHAELYDHTVTLCHTLAGATPAGPASARARTELRPRLITQIQMAMRVRA